MLRVPALAETPVCPVEMALHRDARAGYIVLVDRVQNQPMLRDRARPLVRTVVMMLELCDQRLAHRRPGDTELPCEITFRGQPRAGGKLPGMDQSTNLVGDLTVEPAGFDAVDRHGAAKT